jgi:methionine synthase I (cobalamin-dependent)
MGTRLIDRGLDLAVDDPCLWAVDRPEVVLELHRLDIQAGSDALLTNTFGANRGWLERFGRGGQASEINRQAVRLARSAAGPHCFVCGSIGPTASDRPGNLLAQAEALLNEGVDALILETHRPDQAEAALLALRDLGVPIVASLFAWPDAPDEAARRLGDLGAFALGANCLVGTAAAVALARRLRPVFHGPLAFQPSAGLPGQPNETPSEFAGTTAELVALGVRLLGGCCGTTEAHVGALRAALDRLIPLPSLPGRPVG